MAPAPITVDATPAAAPAAPPAAAPEPVVQDTQALYDAEYGGTPAAEPAAPAAAPAEPAPAAEQELTLEQRLEAAEARAEEAERLARDALRKPEPKPRVETTPEQQAAADPEPNPEDYTYGEADSKYIADLSRWSARQEHAALIAQDNLKTEINGIETRWKEQTSSEEIKELYPDFDEVVTKGADAEKWVCTPLMALGIKQSPVGPHVAYELAKNPAEAERIASFTQPVEQAYQFGLLEGRIAARLEAKAAATPAPEPRLASAAPTPPTNRARGSGGAASSNDISGIQDRMLKEFR